MLKWWYSVAKVHLHNPPRSTLVLHMSDTGNEANGYCLIFLSFTNPLSLLLIRRSLFFLLFTDSFIFSVKYQKGSNRCFYRDLGKMIGFMDFSSYPRTHPLFANNSHIPDLWDICRQNKGKLGLFKDEVSGDRYLHRVIALKPKCYAYTLDNSPEASHMICKGLSKSAKLSNLTFEMYRSVLQDRLPIRCMMRTIRSRSHHIYIEQQSRQTLSLHDDKRFWVSPTFSYALGSPQAVDPDPGPCLLLPAGSKRALPLWPSDKDSEKEGKGASKGDNDDDDNDDEAHSRSFDPPELSSNDSSMDGAAYSVYHDHTYAKRII